MHGSAIVGVVDYQAGNIRSIVNAIEHVGASAIRVTVPSDIGQATHLLLPGVGAFGFCAERLRASGLLPALTQWTLQERRPMLGICVGMQLLADWSDELGRQQGLGWTGGVVEALQAAPPAIRVPHVGWNTVRFDEAFGDFAAGSEADFYFDHSFALDAPTQGRRLAACTHGRPFTAALRHGNVVAAQFHPEKSQTAGMRFLRGFLELSRAAA